MTVSFWARELFYLVLYLLLRPPKGVVLPSESRDDGPAGAAVTPLPLILTLPAELLDTIFDHLEDDRTALMQCTLICRTLTPYVRARLPGLRDVRHTQCHDLYEDSKPCVEDARNILAFAPYMHSLRISVSFGSYETCLVASRSLPVGKFVQLHSLWLGGLAFWSWADFFSILRTLPALKRLVLSSIKTCLLPSARALQSLGPSIPRGEHDDVACSHLEELVCHNLDDEVGFVRGLLELRERLAVEWLELDMSQDGSPDVWTPLAHALAPSLQWLIVRTGISFSKSPATDVRRSYASFFDGLEKCTRLRSLTLGQAITTPIFRRFGPCPAILESLCDFLERPIRLPQLLRLDLGLYDINSTTVTECDWLWERPLRALLNREKYPQARRLMVQMYGDLKITWPDEEGFRRTDRRWQQLFARYLGSDSDGQPQLTCDARVIRIRWPWAVLSRDAVRLIPDGQPEGTEVACTKNPQDDDVASASSRCTS